MADFIQRHSSNAILAALFAGIISLVGSGVSIWMTVHYNEITQERQVRLEQITKFDQSSQSIVDAAASFISAINENDGKALSAARSKLSVVLAAQVNETENIVKFYNQPAQSKASQYQKALEELSQIAQKTATATDMPLWAESFGRVLDTKASLSQELYAQLGVTTRVASRG